MYETEKRFLIEQNIKLNSPVKEEDVNLFEEKYRVKLSSDIKAFYLTINGYIYEEEMVNIYSLNKVKKLNESKIIISEMNDIVNGAGDYFVLGDFGFQASFWLLDVLEDTCKIYVLNLGVVSLDEVSSSFEIFLSTLIKDPYSVIGVQ